MPEVTNTGTTLAPRPADLLDVPDVCSELGVPRSTLYAWWGRGRGPRRIALPNRTVRVRREWLDDFVLNCEVTE